MRTLRSALASLRGCAGGLLLFELIYKLTAAAFFPPAFSAVFRGLMRLTGYKYLTAENLPAFLLHPLTILFFVFVLLMIAAYSALDASVAILLLTTARQGQCPSVFKALRHLTRQCKKALRPGSLGLAAYMLALTVFLHAGIIGAIMATVRIPVVFSNYFQANALRSELLAAAGLLLTCAVLPGLYALPVHLLEGQTFGKAYHKSVRLGGKKTPLDLLRLLAVQALLIALCAALSLLLLSILRLMSGSVARSLLSAHVLTFLTLSLLAVSIPTVPLQFALICALYQERTAQKYALPDLSVEKKASHRKWLRVLSLLLLAVSLAEAGYTVYRSQRGHFTLEIEYLRPTEVTAHRGASAYYPENTLAAFRGALEQGAAWIELDVHLSRDGVVYCLHDSDLKRVTGVKGLAWDKTWAELQTLDAGSHFSPDYAGEPLPTLADALDFAVENDIRLNIELKPKAANTGLEEAVAALIADYDFGDRCVVTCQKYYALERIKEIAPELTTVYVMSVALGDLNQFSAADHFSVNFSFISRSMVSTLHQAGKQIYAWTVDRADIMERMMDLGVDNIITNNVPLARQTLAANGTSEWVQSIWEDMTEDEAEEAPPTAE